MTCSDGLAIFNTLCAPELWLKENHLQKYYAKHPILSRVTIVPLAAVSGFFKVMLFPLICAVGLIALPIIALVKAFRGEADAGAYLKAAGFCLLGCIGTVAFLGITGFHIPIVYSSGMFMTALVVSVTIHVYMAAREPQGKKRLALA